jgi:DNA-binding response OmpR family regulator
MVEMTSDTQMILVVEDESVLRSILLMTLKGEGFFAIEAENGKEGLEVALENRPSLILLDIIMPEMDGIEMLKRLRKDKWGKTANVILLTNLGDSDDIENAKKYGVTDYLVKSDWSIDELTKRIKKVFQ